MKIRKRIQIGIEPLYFKRRYEQKAVRLRAGNPFQRGRDILSTGCSGITGKPADIGEEA